VEDIKVVFAVLQVKLILIIANLVDSINGSVIDIKGRSKNLSQ